MHVHHLSCPISVYILVQLVISVTGVIALRVRGKIAVSDAMPPKWAFDLESEGPHLLLCQQGCRRAPPLALCLAIAGTTIPPDDSHLVRKTKKQKYCTRCRKGRTRYRRQCPGCPNLVGKSCARKCWDSIALKCADCARVADGPSGLRPDTADTVAYDVELD